MNRLITLGAIAAALSALLLTNNPAFQWLISAIVVYIIYEIGQTYDHINYHIIALHERVRRMEKAGERDGP